MNVLSLAYALLTLGASLGAWIFTRRGRLFWIVLVNGIFLWFLRARMWEWLYVVMLCVWIYGIALLEAAFPRLRRLFAIPGIGLPLFVLIAFKYGGAIGHSHIMLLGLSFYTFKAVSYVLDVCNGHAKAQKNPAAIFAYIAFFPTFMAGPIHRAQPFFDALKKPFVFSYKDQTHGLLLAAMGVFEKLVIAGILQELTAAFQDTAQTGWYTVLGILFYGFYLYADFDAYSNIAIGVARLLGFHLPANFRSPYLSASMGEFWRRWHISLGAWLRDYVYIPLGGSRKGAGRKHLNVLIVFLISGIWHGSTWMFVFWGLGCGLVILIEQDLAKSIPVSPKLRGLCILGNDILMLLLWVLFCSPSMGAALDTYRRAFMIVQGAPAVDYASVGLTRNTWVWGLLTLAVLILFDVLRDRTDMIAFLQRRRWPVRILFIWLLLTVAIIFGAYGPGFHASSFVYSRF